jgi:predicted ATP-binding protein involved in virulence
MSANTIRVQKVELTHFRGIQHLTLEFSERVTVLVGVNGAGKTSIIEALRAILRPLLVLVADRVTGNNPTPDEELHPPYLQESDVQVGHRSVSLAINTVIAGLNLSWTLHGQSKLAGEISQDGTWDPITSLAYELGEQVKTNPQTALPLAIYYAVGRNAAWGNDTLGDDAVENQTVAYEFALKDPGPLSTSKFVSWFRRREDYENEKRIDEVTFRDAQLQAVRRAVEEILPGWLSARGALNWNSDISQMVSDIC